MGDKFTRGLVDVWVEWELGVVLSYHVLLLLFLDLLVVFEPLLKLPLVVLLLPVIH